MTHPRISHSFFTHTTLFILSSLYFYLFTCGGRFLLCFGVCVCVWYEACHCWMWSMAFNVCVGVRTLCWVICFMFEMMWFDRDSCVFILWTLVSLSSLSFLWRTFQSFSERMSTGGCISRGMIMPFRFHLLSFPTQEESSGTFYIFHICNGTYIHHSLGMMLCQGRNWRIWRQSPHWQTPIRNIRLSPHIVTIFVT